MRNKPKYPLILIVDDDLSILRVLTLLLEEEGYQVKATSTLPSLTEIKQLQPDLILMDVFLAGKDGRRLTQIIKGDRDLKKLPVILASAINTIEPSVYTAGADLFMAKPFDMFQLLDEVNERVVSV